MISTITLNPSIDQHILVDKLVKDDANRALSVTHFPGGKGVNVSHVIKELGGSACAYALIGGRVGEVWKGLADEAKISACSFLIKGETRINTILTDHRDHTQTRISAPGPRVNMKILNAFLKKLLSAHPMPRYWVLGGSLPPGLPSTAYRHLILALENAGASCVLDADNEALREGIKATPFMIKPNEYEMQRLMGRKMAETRDYARAAREIVKQGVQLVVVSLGKRGALFISGTEQFFVNTPKVRVKSKVGAGDSLIGGFLWSLARNKDLKEAARMGVAASTSAVMTEGTRLCRRQDIPKLLPKIRAVRL